MDSVALMRLALEQAQKSLWITSPNPRVGCVLERDGVILGVGATQLAGQDHAEVQAIKHAKRQGHRLQGATAYVTLEPCSHHGRTPPCVDALIREQISKVVVMMSDPNPLVAGHGLQRLQQAGIVVERLQDQLLLEACVELNVGFFWRMMTQRPWVRTKLATSLDGRTALSNGQSKWITGDLARQDGHYWRARSCAVLTGIGTILADDAQLTVRLEQETLRQPYRIVLDTHLRLPLTARLLQLDPQKVIVFTSATQLLTPMARALQDRGVSVYGVSLDAVGRLNLHEVMARLAQLQFNEIHVEAGSILNGALYEQELLDEILLYQAPKILGHHAKASMNMPELTSLEAVQSWEWVDCCLLGEDVRLQARHRIHWQSIFNTNLYAF